MDSTQLIEALIFISDKPIAEEAIKTTLEDQNLNVETAVQILNDRYQNANFCFRIKKVGRGYAFMSLPEFDEPINKFLKTTIKPKKFTKSAIETLSIIAYKQPIKRQEIDSIRGASSQDIIKLLLEQELITVSEREKGTGALLYKTTDKFLELVGISSLQELPKPEEL